MNLQQTVYNRVIEWAMDVDPADCRREIAWRRKRFPNAQPRELAKSMLTEYSLVSLAEGTLTALATGPIFAVPAAMVDAAFIMRAAARLNGCIGLMANPDYFATNAWRADVTTIIGDKPVAEQTIRRTAINVANRTLVQVVTSRSAARFIPFVGGIVGGVWNFWELNRLGKRIFAYHFDDTLASHPWPDDVIHREESVTWVDLAASRSGESHSDSEIDAPQMDAEVAASANAAETAPQPEASSASPHEVKATRSRRKTSAASEIESTETAQAVSGPKRGARSRK
jgi:hypothetical protein